MFWQASYSFAKFYHCILLFNGYNYEEYKKTVKDMLFLGTAIEKCLEKRLRDLIHLVF